MVIGLEIGFALFKFFKGQWTYKIAIFNIIYEVIATVVMIVIIMNPNLFQPEFVSFMTDLFSVSAEQFTRLDHWRSHLPVCPIWWMGNL